ncbi:MAG: hypothetical protein U9N38_01440, partial [Thermodesulfobacteriota bacterium]|nr:hypothetical protein [Thermodesulfobacteriota bacterium]
FSSTEIKVPRSQNKQAIRLHQKRERENRGKCIAAKISKKTYIIIINDIIEDQANGKTKEADR